MSITVKVGHSSGIKEGQNRALRINGKKIVIFRHKNRLYALRNSCPHQGAPLSDGAVTNGQVVCLYHGWRFRLEDGAFIANPNLKLPTYSVREEEGFIYLDLDE